MTNSNNSGNNRLPQGQNGQVLTTNGNWVIPVNTTGASTGGTITWNPTVPGQTYTITIGGGGGGGGGAQISNPFIDIDLAVPVDEKKKKSDGCSCKKCKEFFEYAEPNQEDGTLICWACRHGY